MRPEGSAGNTGTVSAVLEVSNFRWVVVWEHQVTLMPLEIGLAFPGLQMS
jgi:hypothetical protein